MQNSSNLTPYAYASSILPLSMIWRGVHPEGDKGGEVYEAMLNLSDHEIQ
jgi:hypothetical protein